MTTIRGVSREGMPMAENDSRMRDMGRAAMQSAHAGGVIRPKRKKSVDAESVADTIATVVAVFLCLVNALVWAFISGLPLVGIGWVLAAAACLKLRAWARG